jgi:glutamate/tyrosine decarboxylase-like PLP-dependent enzyme
MHEFTPEVEALAAEILKYSLERLKDDPPLDGPRSAEDLFNEVGNTITAKGLGGHEALQVFTNVLAKACISTDHPRNLAFIPSAPSEYANLFDLVVGASALYGGSWQEGAGAVFAENQAIQWLIDLAGLPATAGGVFVQGGTILKIPVDSRGKLQGSAVAEAIDHLHATTDSQVFAVVATSGTTNLGIIDDLKGLSKAAHDRGIWFHVDGAYGLAALCAPSVRKDFDGIENADSFIVDPHKWLFAPYDACALVYRNPDLAKQAHSQHASYLDTLKDDNWSPSDYAINLTRRTRGLPFWFSLAAHGTDAYAEAMEQTLSVAQQAAELVRKHPNLELLCEPELSIVAFTRKGWASADYQKWSDRLLEDQVGFIPPSSHNGQPILRFAIVNPWTKITDIQIILDRL